MLLGFGTCIKECYGWWNDKSKWRRRE